MIGIRSTLTACNCTYRLYDCGIHRRINAETTSSVYDVPIDEVNLGCTFPFEVLQHGRLQFAISIPDFNEPQLMRFLRNTSFIPSRRDRINQHFLWPDSAYECYRESFVVRPIEQLAPFRSIDVLTHCPARNRPLFRRGCRDSCLHGFHSHLGATPLIFCDHTVSSGLYWRRTLAICFRRQERRFAAHTHLDVHETCPSERWLIGRRMDRE